MAACDAGYVAWTGAETCQCWLAFTALEKLTHSGESPFG